MYANDLNPESHRYLVRNSALNKVQGRVQSFNMDGREFIRLLLDKEGSHHEGERDGAHEVDGRSGGEGPSHSQSQAMIASGFRPPSSGLVFNHVVMNLPASAIEFLDVFKGLFDPKRWRDQGRDLPWIHVYTFKKGTETEDDIVAKAEGFLGGKLEKRPEIHVVRDVAPNKLMLCLTFRLPEAIAYATDSKEAAEGKGEGVLADEVPESKRRRTEFS